MKAVVFTLGCKVNECESDSLIEGLLRRGYEVSDKLCFADVYIVNTCAVTAEAEKKSRQTVSRILKINPRAKIIFTGCAAQKNPEAFAAKGDNVLVTGSFNKSAILDALDKSGVMVSPESKTFEELLPVRSLRTRTFVKVQDGCDNFCSYCIIPYLRGRSRSRSPESVLSEIERVNPKEAVINGINLSAYDYCGQGLTELMNAISGVSCRIRLGSLEARVITDEFLTSLKNLKNFARHFHLSLQSGSDAVLKKMNRKYTAEEYYEKVCLIRKYFPEAGITTDVIAGFPTETDENFRESVEFINKVAFSDIHPFTFSPRKGTAAFNMKDLPPEVKKERLDELLKTKARLKSAFIDKIKGKIFSVLFEENKGGFTEGYTDNYVRVFVKDDVPAGEFKKVIITGETGAGALGDIV